MARKKVQIKKLADEHIDQEGSWMISYGDMITLLLSFFVIFFSMDFAEKNDNLLEASLISQLSQDTENLNEKFTVGNTTDPESFKDDAQLIIDNSQKGQMTVFFKGQSFFDSGETQLNANGEKNLRKFIKKFLPFAGKYKVKIQAFTDATPVTKNKYRYKDNTELSALRSIAAFKVFKDMGVPDQRVEIGGKGIMTKKTHRLLNIDIQQKEKVQHLSRTIALKLFREDLK